MYKISLIHPSWKRPELARKCYDTWMGKADNPQDIEYVLCLSKKDPTNTYQRDSYSDMFHNTQIVLTEIADNGLVRQMNHAATVCTGNLIIAISDDFVCPDGWDTLLLNELAGKSDYVVKTQDGLQPYIMTLPMMDRAFYNRLGYIYHPEYNHMYGDEELADVGKLLNKTITLPHYFRHEHYSTGINAKDDVNAKNDSFMMIDKETYTARKKKNFDVFLLSILIPTMPKRAEQLAQLLAKLKAQIGTYPIEILTDDSDATIGAKRNTLLQSAKGEYLCFFDDDDIPAEHYIYSIMSAIQSNPDCCSLNGVITTDGKNPKRFIHSIQYNSWFEKEEVYYRPPNHLNVIKSSIAKQFPFPEKNFGEDADWSMAICKSELLKTEAVIDETLYYYKFISVK